ncbi:15062_t:CDS:2 [Dentiscutata erythropus]|uniref:15062_t:CDS:1 n=1 Tax=Dentiscutata erythropus TaxID=1348616 RepID=A0A9N9BK71_9GLOM|nr:15062_t:CDS:2 [Dentiscutata erythropus]
MDFVGYISGVMGLIVGSPLDVLKVRLQTVQSDSPSHTFYKSSSLKILMKMKQTEGFKSFFKGVGSPIIGLAFLNSILFTSYGSILRFFENIDNSSQRIPSLTQVYVAGFGSGVACFLVSTPTELVKCKAQAAKQKGLMISSTTWNVFKDVIQTRGVKGLYQGGLITIIRDAPGYVLKRSLNVTSDNFDRNNGPKLLFSGGMAGVLSWASIYPLDVIKSRIQTQQQPKSTIMNKTMASFVNYNQPLTKIQQPSASYSGIIDCAVRSYRKEGISVFFKGITPTLVRALPVNAVTFYVYEIMIRWLNRFQN